MDEHLHRRTKGLLQITEMVPPEIYNELGEKAWDAIHPELVSLVCQIKDFFKDKQVIINTWASSTSDQRKYGYFTERGYRNPESTTGAKNSAHKKGKAFDFDVWEGSRRIDSDNVRKQLMNHLYLFPSLKAMEIKVNWTHLDIMFDQSLRSGQIAGEVYLFDTHGFCGSIPKTSPRTPITGGI